MPFLWEHVKQLLSNFISPSPKHSMRSARSGGSIERVSLSASLGARIAAAMTVEAAIVLPLFLFFFINLGCAIEMIRLHGNLELALWNAGNKLCVYGYVLGNEEETAEKAAEEEDRRWWDGMAGIALSYTYLKSDVVNYTGSDYLEESPLSRGVAGLQFLESDLPMPDDRVDILMTYQVSPWADIPAVWPFRMQNRYYGHLWTGYKIPAAVVEQDENLDVVYVAENASVYHESPQCTHIKLTIREVTLAEAKTARNESGGRYEECLKCKKYPFKGTVFIGREGDSYHYIRECPGLKRTVRTMPRQEAVKKYRPCSRCAGG